MGKSRILITCAKGIPPLLAEELRELGFPVLSQYLSGVETEGSFAETLVLNLHIRTGHRVLLQLKELTAYNADALYQELLSIPWEEYLPADGYLCVTSSVENETIRDARFASLKCKDAIVDRIKQKTGRRPDSGPLRDRSVVHLYWKDDRAIVYLDTSGEPLSRRGYRKIPLAAPMQETLAAAVVLSTGWTGSGNFINPLCGSGTLAIEAALLAGRRAPGLLRSNFGFMHLRGFDQRVWEELLRLAEERRPTPPATARIIATDIEPRAVEAARKNAAAAGVEQAIEFGQCDFRRTTLPGSGIIVMNPPYGERMGDLAALEVLYRDIGDFLKRECTGYRAYVFTGNPALAKKVSLKPARSLPFYNSGIECRLLEYELYAGTKKVKKERARE